MNLGISKTLARFGLLLTPVVDVAKVWGKFRPIVTEHELVRVGSKSGDGGYLLPDSLADLDGVFSAGLSDNVDFEFELAQSLQIQVECVDASITSLPLNHQNLKFQKKFLAATSEGDYINLEDWIEGSSLAGQNLLLKMDIEGFEYESMLAASTATLNRFKIMVFELHSLEQIGTRLGMSLISNFASKITRNHTVIHAHANNVGGEWVFPSGRYPASLEITLIRNDAFVTNLGYARLPHELDRRCVAYLPEVVASW